MESSTEILRRLLDERGVEYEVYIEQPTGFEHVRWSFGELGSADFNLEFGEPWLTMYGIISGPEQAIAATLGPCSDSCNCTNGERTGERTGDELLPCPFCGGEARIVTAVGESWVLCDKCKATTEAHTSRQFAIAA